jgi:hypothetical protein
VRDEAMFEEILRREESPNEKSGSSPSLASVLRSFVFRRGLLFVQIVLVLGLFVGVIPGSLDW